MKKKVKNTKKSIRLRVKNALKKREHIKAYRPTLPVAQSWFRTLNRGLFNGRLVEPDMFVKRLVGDWGRVVANWDNRKCRAGTYNQSVIPYEKAEIEYRLELHWQFPKWKDFIETLAHEWCTYIKCKSWKTHIQTIITIFIVSEQNLKGTV